MNGKTHPSLSVIITTYNTPHFLEYCLLGYSRQTISDFELIIADDGSTEETAAVIERYAAGRQGGIRHVWQEDHGYRKCHILNKGIRASAGEYLIFADGDCVPHSRFVQDHVECRAEKTALTSRRVKWGEEFSKTITKEYIASGAYETLDPRLLLSALRGDTRRISRGLRIENAFLNDLINRGEKLLSGCSFSLERVAMETINGFDEEYEGPGFGPDRDVDVRLNLAGYTVRPLLHKALQYHLHHLEVPRPPQNRERYDRLLQERWVQCQKGLQSLSDGRG